MRTTVETWLARASQVALLAPLARALPGGPARVLPWRCSRPRQGACRGSCGFPRLGSRRGSSSSGPHRILYASDLHKDLHATTEVPPEPWTHVVDGVGDVGSRVARPVGVWARCPGKGLAGETAPPLCFFAFLVLALIWLPRASVLPWFTSPALLGVAVGAAPTAHAQVKGYKVVPLLLYTEILAP